MLRFLVLLMVAGALFGQGTNRPDAAQYVKHAGGTKTVGYCLVWDSFGLVTSATCGAGGGETNAGANLGTGSLVYSGKSGVNLQFRSFTVGSNKLSVTQNTNDIAFDVIPANLLLSSLGGSLNLSQLAQGGATTGQLIQWNGTAWAPASVSGGGGPANTDALAEGSTNLYSTTGRIRAALSVTGILSYNNGTGVFSCSNCADITSSYANPSWISTLAYAKITGVPSFELLSNKGAVSGYAGLGAGGLVPTAQLGTGTANSTVFLRGDGTWTSPSGSVNVQLNAASIGTRPGLNLINGTGIDLAITDDAGNNRVNATITSVLNSANSLDMKMYRTSGTVLTFNTGASPSTPHNVRVGSQKYGFTAASTATITAGTGSGSGFYYVTNAGALTFGHNSSNTIVNSGTGITIVGSISAYPPGAIPLYSIDIVTGAWGTTITDDRAFLSVGGDITSAGGSITVTKTLGGFDLASNGVTSATGAADEITVSAATGAVTWSIASVLNLSSKTLRVPNSTTLPATCTVGNSYMDTDATSGARWFLCESTNTWVAQGGGGGGGSPGGSGTEIQYRSGASTFGAVTGSSTSGGSITIVGDITAGANGRIKMTQNGGGGGHIGMTGSSLNTGGFGGGEGLYPGSTALDLYVGQNQATNTLIFPSAGGIQLKAGTKATCAVGTRGAIYYTAGAGGVKDNFEVCGKDAADVYAWRLIY